MSQQAESRGSLNLRALGAVRDARGGEVRHLERDVGGHSHGGSQSEESVGELHLDGRVGLIGFGWWFVGGSCCRL